MNSHRPNQKVSTEPMLGNEGSLRAPFQQGGSSETASPGLNFHIDRLILHGFSAVDRHHIGAAMQAELSRLFAEEGIPASLAQGGAINQLDGGVFEMASGLPPRIIGIRIARSLYRGLSHE